MFPWLMPLDSTESTTSVFPLGFCNLPNQVFFHIITYHFLVLCPSLTQFINAGWYAKIGHNVQLTELFKPFLAETCEHERQSVQRGANTTSAGLVNKTRQSNRIKLISAMSCWTVEMDWWPVHRFPPCAGWLQLSVILSYIKHWCSFWGSQSSNNKNTYDRQKWNSPLFCKV